MNQETNQPTPKQPTKEAGAWGAYNEAVAVFGAPGTGKSYFMEHFLVERTKSAYVIAFDPTHSFRHNQGLVFRYGNPQQLLGQGLKQHPQGIHCLDFAHPTVVLQTAISLCNALKVKNDTTPVLLAIDEVVGFDGMSPFHISEDLQKAYLWRRHFRLGFVFGSQRPQAVHPTFYDSCTDMVLFRLTNQKAHGRLLEFGCPKEIVTQLGALPNYHHLTCKPGQLEQALPPGTPPDSEGPDTGEPSQGDQGAAPSSEVPQEPQ